MKLKPKQIEAICLLASGKIQREVAKELDCTPETISIWKREPEFIALLNKTKQEILNSTIAKLQSVALDAANELERIMKNSNTDETRRKACIDVLTLAGIKDPMSGSFGWKIGPESAKGVESEKARQAQLDDLIEGLATF